MESYEKAWQKLKAWLRRTEKSDLYNGDECKVLMDVAKQMEAIEKEKLSDWTFCSDELPTEDGMYLATIRRIAPEDLGANSNFIRKERFRNGKFRTRHSGSHEDFGVYDEIIAWKPMPECAIKNKCQTCTYQEYNVNFGLICTHRASMEGIEAAKAFYTPDEVTDDCPFYRDEESDECRNPITGCKTKGTSAESYEREYIAYGKAMGYIKDDTTTE